MIACASATICCCPPDKFARPGLKAFTQFGEGAERNIDRRSHFGARQMAAGDLEIVLDAQLVQNLVSFRDRGQPARANGLRPQAPDRAAIEGDLAGGRRKRAGDRQHEAALAGAVGAQQRGDPSGLERQIDTVQDRFAVAGEIEVLHYKACAHVAFSSTPR
ncbi:hypothetical protein ACVIGA_007642 [Bradyrhizobium sp. USDA 3240]